MASSYNMVKTGKVSGSGAAKKVILGFKPRVVELFNAAAGGLISVLKLDSMDAAYARKVAANGAQTFDADCCTLNADGFTIGVDADLNAAGEEIHYIAYEGKND